MSAKPAAQLTDFDRIVLVGACAIDTILKVPHYPTEDSKLRAHSVTHRRGGNTPNTAEVLHQLVLTSSSAPSKLKVHLINVFPSKSSPAFKTIRESLDPSITTSYSIFRENHTEAISSYIVSSAAADSRTIITHNELPEMAVNEFKDSVGALIRDPAGSDGKRTWFHFEGRIPETTKACMEYLKELQVKHGIHSYLSVEVEKPGREGLQELAQFADVVFYSKAWALGQGYSDAETCLVDQARQRGDRPAECLICTWGDQGSCALAAWDQEIPLEHMPTRADELVVIHADAVRVSKVVDPVGAGDTFIAAVLHTMTSSDWASKSTLPKLRFANECAARKISQEGFANLVE